MFKLLPYDIVVLIFIEFHEHSLKLQQDQFQHSCNFLDSDDSVEKDVVSLCRSSAWRDGSEQRIVCIEQQRMVARRSRGEILSL